MEEDIPTVMPVGLRLDYSDERQPVMQEDEDILEQNRLRKMAQRKEQAERLRESIQKKREEKRGV